MGWRARERELTGLGWLSGDSTKADKNSRKGPGRGDWILYTGPFSLGLGENRQDGESPGSVNMCLIGAPWVPQSSNSGQCDIFQKPPFDGDESRWAREGMGRGGLAGRGLWLQQAGTWKGSHWPSWNPACWPASYSAGVWNRRASLVPTQI